MRGEAAVSGEEADVFGDATDADENIEGECEVIEGGDAGEGNARRYHPPEYVNAISWCSTRLGSGVSPEDGTSIQQTVQRSSSMVSSLGAVMDGDGDSEICEDRLGSR